MLGGTNRLLQLELPREGDRSISRRSVTWLRSRDKFSAASKELRNIQIDLLLALTLTQSLSASRASLTCGITEDKTASEISVGEEEQQQHFQVIRPASPLELSPAFMPELYTVDKSFPTLFTNRSQQLDLSEHTLTNLYSMFYRARGRQWIRITASVTISVESGLFQLARLAHDSITGLEPAGPLAKAIKQFLDAQREDVEMDAHVDLYVGARFRDDFTSISSTSSAIARLAKSFPRSLPVKSYLLEAAEAFYHGRYHFIPDSRIVQVPLPKRSKGYFFLSSYRSEWMLDFRFSLDADINRRYIYIVKALHHLRGCDGISELVGLITADEEDARHAVKGFLIRLPPGGHLLHYLGTHRHSIPWHRRERWCREVVNAVAATHARDVVVGHLGYSGNRGVCIDAHDSVVLYYFYPAYRFIQRTLEDVVPPEHRKRAAELGGVGTLPATPQTDIFQLGMMIWLIASGRESRPPGMEMKGAQLPHLDDDVPEYINHIIAECRREQASERRAAWELLEMFPPPPPSPSPSSPDRDGPTAAASALEVYKQLFYYSSHGHCDGCGEPLPAYTYKCTVCDLGDFDVCPTCFDAGKHCMDNNHYLAKSSFEEPGLRVFYSSVRENGREVVDLGI